MFQYCQFDVTAEAIEVIESVPLTQLLCILDNARTVTGNEALGLLLGVLLHPSTQGSIGWATINSPTLGDAIDVLSRYVTLQIPFYGCSSYVSDGEFIIRVDTIGDLQDSHALLVECALLLLQHMAEDIVGHEVKDARIITDFPAPNYADLYRDYFHSPVTFGAEFIEYRLPVALRNVANSTANVAMYELALDQCRAANNKLRRSENFADSVADLLEKNLEQQLTLEQVSHRLNYSSRTVMRKLQKAGATYQAIRDDIYSSKAAQYMLESDISVNGVSELLGFTDPANFRRSFKRWFKLNPKNYREKYKAD